MTFMRLHRWWQVACVIVCLFSSSLVEGLQSYYENELDAFLAQQANKEIRRPRTDVFFNVSLPSNFTGMEVSVVRLRSVSLWIKGMNYSFFSLPPQIMVRPNAKRITILYENLGNLSSHYYNVPNHTMVAPVFGLRVYSSSKSAFINKKIKFNIQGDPIIIQFPHVEQYGQNGTPICANFGAGELVNFHNMTKPYVCEAQSQGHYTLVVPSFPSPKEPHSKRFTKWWVLGFVIGFAGLVILILILQALIKEVKRRRIREMERNSLSGELFDTFWIGETKLPIASVIRTEPILENGNH